MMTSDMNASTATTNAIDCAKSFFEEEKEFKSTLTKLCARARTESASVDDAPAYARLMQIVGVISAFSFK